MKKILLLTSLMFLACTQDFDEFDNPRTYLPADPSPTAIEILPNCHTVALSPTSYPIKDQQTWLTSLSGSKYLQLELCVCSQICDLSVTQACQNNRVSYADIVACVDAATSCFQEIDVCKWDSFFEDGDK